MTSSQNTPNHILGYHDILDHIFSACSDPDADYCDDSRNLSQVCRGWRDFMVTSPKYWTAVKMRCGAGESQHLWTRTLLERSKDQPLTLHIHATSLFYRDEVAKVLQNYAGRVRRLIVDSEIDQPATAIWREFQLFMSEGLEFFDYRQKDGARVTTERDVALTAFTKSHLFQYPLTGGPESSHLKLSTWQMRSITSLTIDYSFGSGSRISNRDFCAILMRNMDTLEHLEIVDVAPILSALEYPVVVTLPRLVSLILSYKRAAALIPLVETLHIPVLRSLVLRDISRAPEPSTPKHFWGIIEKGIPDYMDGGFELLQAFLACTTITHIQLNGIRCHTPTVLFEEIRLESLVLIDSDQVFASLICSQPPPTNGWKKDCTPGLTRSGLSLADLAVTSANHELFADYLAKRKAARCPPLRFLALSPGCLHSAFVGSIKEKKIEKVSEEAGVRVDLATECARDLKLIPQPVLGVPYQPETIALLTKGGDVFNDGLWGLIPDVIPSSGEDSDDEMDAKWSWLAEVEDWDDTRMEL